MTCHSPLLYATRYRRRWCTLHCYVVSYCLLEQLFFISPPLYLYRCPHVFHGARHCSCVLPTSYKQQRSYSGSGTWSVQKGSGVYLPPYNLVVDMRQCKRQLNWRPASSLGHALNDRIVNKAKQNDILYQLRILNPPNLDDMDGNMYSYLHLQLPDTSKIQDCWNEYQRTRMRYTYDGAQLLQWRTGFFLFPWHGVASSGPICLIGWTILSFCAIHQGFFNQAPSEMYEQ